MAAIERWPLLKAGLTVFCKHLRGWAEKFIGWLWCNSRIWPNVIFNMYSLPCGPHTSSRPSRVAALGFLILTKVLNFRYDLIIGLPSQVFFHVGEQKIDGAKSGEYGWLSTSSEPQLHTAAIAITDMCAGALSWWNRTLFVSFPGCFEISLVLLFKVLNWLSTVGLENLEGKNAVSIRKGLI